MNSGQLESVKMMEVVVSQRNKNNGTQKWLLCSTLVVVVLLLMIGNQDGRPASMSQSISSAAKSISLTAQALVSSSPIEPVINAGALPDVKASHKVSQSLPSGTLPSGSSLVEDQQSPPKVRVRLFMESKCPACKMFTSKYVNKVLHADGVS
jgi:protein-disulfide isomerase